ncbi:DUF6807 domain-containing protein [Tuwongella immobilis]|nr:PmoA family protein [Tuwongella immobilis]
MWLTTPLLSHAEPHKVEITFQNHQLSFKADGKLVTTYHAGPQVAKPYFWPILTPKGVPVTRAWPMEKGMKGETTDHVHQKSAWFCHGDVIAEGISSGKKIPHVEGIDFWSETPGHGKIVCVEIQSPTVKDNHGTVVTKNVWKTADGTPIMSELRTIHFQALDQGSLLIMESTLTADVTNITFGDTKEGAFGVRVSDAIAVKPGGGQFTNSLGNTGEASIWGKSASWCDYVGKVNNQTAGIAVLDHPKNPHPAYWHARGYGLMAANPFGREKSGFPGQKGKKDLVKLAKGQSLTVRYGIYAHDGDTNAAKVNEVYTQFSGK